MASKKKIDQFIATIPDKRTGIQLRHILDARFPTADDIAVTASTTQTQAGAQPLKIDVSYHEVTTVATVANAISLPPAKVGEIHFVKNSGANAMQVYGAGTDTIDSVATATGVSQQAAEGVIYVCLVAGNYIRLGGVDATSIFTAITTGAITGGDSSLGIDGQAAAQGGAIVVTGGASSTATNAGGAVSLIGGTGNTSGAGGAANLTGGTGGATGVGGQVNITGGVPIAAAGGAVVIAGAAGVGTNKAGGLASVTGGASTGSATGGVASLVGGAASAATGAGGGIVITAADGNTTGAAGTVVITAGQGGATNVAGGVASLTGGIGNGTGIGGVASLVGGLGGVGGATGKGGAAKVTGGASSATNADGGGVVLGGGAKNGTAFVGPIVLGNAQLTPIFYPQAAPAADGADSPITMTIAQMIAGIVSMTPTTGRAVTTPTGAEMDAGIAFADIPATFGFDFSVQNRAAFAATDDILTLTAGASGVTVTGSAVVSPGSTARFRATRTAANTWIIYKIAG